MDIYWLEQTLTDVPSDDNWLCASEAQRLESLRFPHRRADWRLGRWTAKRAIAAYLTISSVPHPEASEGWDFSGNGADFASIEIRPADSGAPEVFFADTPAPLAISLSHREGTAVCAVAQPGTVLGCDLEAVEPRSERFLADYFTAGEQALVAQALAGDRDWFVALLWSAKESALKALRTGLRLDTRSVIATPGELLRSAVACWHSLQVCCLTGEVFHGWWQLTGKLVQTVVANPAPATPIVLGHRTERRMTRTVPRTRIAAV